ncbi:MAG: hypothetical protein HZA84_08805 [Thaumarchaeota archaeon]|nr:hypothetical protein [Nitrososphaerota archaeon]
MPEFCTGTTIILTMSTTSIIVISAKTQLNLLFRYQSTLRIQQINSCFAC